MNSDLFKASVIIPNYLKNNKVIRLLVVDNQVSEHHLPQVETTENDMILAGYPPQACTDEGCIWCRSGPLPMVFRCQEEMWDET